MTSSVPDVPEGFNYGGKYGWVHQESKSFDDLQDILKGDYLKYKLVKLKIWSGQKDNSDVLYGIQAFYKNYTTGKIIESPEYKGEGFTKVEEFDIQSNEYLSNFNVRFDTEITRVAFKTNKDWYMKRMCFGYFELRYKLKKDEDFKKEWYEKINNLDNFQKALLKTCSLPDAPFTEIIKFCI